MSAAIPLGTALRHRYGPAAAARFTAGMSASVIAQQSLVGLVLRREGSPSGPRQRHGLSLVDAITLSRGGAAALMVGLLTSGIRDRRGRAGWLGWTALLYGAIVSDWLDGPIARRLGTSELGATLDIEADSWLTLSTSAVAVAAGGGGGRAVRARAGTAARRAREVPAGDGGGGRCAGRGGGVGGGGAADCGGAPQAKPGPYVRGIDAAVQSPFDPFVTFDAGERFSPVFGSRTCCRRGS